MKEAAMGFAHFLWLMIVFFIFVAWIWILVSVVADIFRRKDASGWTKALWILFIVVVPLIGVFCYIIFNGDSMNERVAKDISQAEEVRREYIREVAGSSPADQLEKLAALRDNGVLTEEEFQAQKAKILEA